ncbi:hypothetical protein Gogos_000208, partial [Gossypium gossypioides]|nr:hypothetical protein [Gossypium gossypioides]
MDALLSAPEITSQSLSTSPGSSSSSSSLTSNDDSEFVTSSVSGRTLEDNGNGKTNDSNENGEGKFETVPERLFMADPDEVIPTVRDVSDAPFVGSDGSNVILNEDSFGGGDNGLEEYRGEGSMGKVDVDSVGNGEKDDKVEMGSIGEVDQSVLSMESGEEGRIGIFENNLVLDGGAKGVNPMIVETVDHQVVEVDGSKFSGEEELAVDAKPLTGAALGIETSVMKETEVLPVDDNASLDNGLNHADGSKFSGGEELAVDAENKADTASGVMLGKDNSATELNDLKDEEVIDILEQAFAEKVDGGGGDGIQAKDTSAQPTEIMAAHETENLDSDSQSKRSVTLPGEESHLPESVEQTTVARKVSFEGSETDGEAESMFFKNAEAAKQFLEELERGSAIGSHSGADTSHNHIQTNAVDSDEEGDTDEEGEGKELFDSAALAALLKAATGAGSDGGNITITSQDGSRLFTVERPAGLGSSLQNATSAPRSNRPNIFSPAVTSRGDSDNNLTEEDKIKLEKLQLIRVKFLRILQRLGLSTEDSLAAQVLYRLAHVARRQTSELFSVDSAKRKALELETEGKDDLSFSINMLVLGKIGVGKSATINSIFGESKTSIHAFEPATTVVKEITGMVDGVKLRIIDTPGLKSSAMEQGANHKVLASIKQYIKKCPPDVVVYVDRLDSQTRDLND